MFEEIASKVMKTVTDGLREADKMFIELEEKRMEFEAQQKREERQFQLHLAQMLVGQPSRPPYHYPSYSHQFYGSQPQYYPDIEQPMTIAHIIIIYNNMHCWVTTVKLHLGSPQVLS